MAAITGNITILNGAISLVTDSGATAAGPSGAAIVNITGTWSATVAFQGSSDGINFFAIAAYPVLAAGILGAPILSVTANNTVVVPVYGYQSVRIIATSYTSGTVQVAVDGAVSAPTGNLSVNTEGVKATYGATTAAFSAGTSATTTIAQLVGSATKTIRVTRVLLSGTIATTAANFAVLLIKRSTAASGGTPVAATIAPFDSNDAAATGVVNAYTAAPTAGTSVGTVAGGNIFMSVAPALAQLLAFDFGYRPSRCPVLRGVAQSLDLTIGNATPGTASSIQATFEWTEE